MALLGWHRWGDTGGAQGQGEAAPAGPHRDSKGDLVPSIIRLWVSPGQEHLPGSALAQPPGRAPGHPHPSTASAPHLGDTPGALGDPGVWISPLHGDTAGWGPGGEPEGDKDGAWGAVLGWGSNGGAGAVLRGAGAVLRGAGGTMMGGGDSCWLGEERSEVGKGQGTAPEQRWGWVSSELGWGGGGNDGMGRGQFWAGAAGGSTGTGMGTGTGQG